MTFVDTDFPISEIFESIQGEGNFVGANSLFIRFQLCNLTCTWCDTKYTWTQFSDRFTKPTLTELQTTIRETCKYHIILTGGEPSLFRLDLLNNHNRKIHVESNGSIIPVLPLNLTLHDGSIINRQGMHEEVIRQYNWVISPKLSNSRQEIFTEALEYWAEKEFAIFKFIIDSYDDLLEVVAVCKKFNIPQTKTYIGLMGNTPQSQLRAKLVDEIVRLGYNFSPRLQVLFWGKERGR